jgi:signal transduction histidine kinase
MAQMSVSRLLGTTIGLLFALAVLGVGLALLANGQLTRERHLLLDDVGPSLRNSLKLENGLINEETGVRGYLIASRREFLAPYYAGLEDEDEAYAALHAREHAVGQGIAADVERVRREADAWRQKFVAGVLGSPHRLNRRTVAQSVQGKELFDGVRVALTRLQAALTHEDLQARAHVSDAANQLELLLVLAGVLILGGVLGAGLLLRMTITLPLAKLGEQARRVGAGEFHSPLAIAGGPREVSEVGAEIEAMRKRIVEELASAQAARRQVEEQAMELQRSNAELEQFAYVASHDLQEPLRKIASFCQALQTRYHGELDARADQYIEFAVDGAKRMQMLISDLLEFSRVGRSGRERELVPLQEPLQAAKSTLAQSIERSGAKIEAGELPAVRADRALLSSLFQNLISNSLKFRREAPPVVRIAARRASQEWEISCEDNGIGIEDGESERIFLIFQRLHSREVYEGSGIGLALCRKIVEYHGGRIWLDPSGEQGACFRFTLPVAEEDRELDGREDGAGEGEGGSAGGGSELAARAGA